MDFILDETDIKEACKDYMDRKLNTQLFIDIDTVVIRRVEPGGKVEVRMQLEVDDDED